MRIIAGTLGGRQFESPHGHHTHPMSEKVRGALFNMLGDITDLTVLDPFAGSGALCYEAMSRGASEVQAIELDKTAQSAVRQNTINLGLADKISLFPGNCLSWSSRNRTKLFDLVLCDPPYDRILIRSIQKLGSHAKVGGLLALSWPGHLKAEDLVGFEQLKISNYGDAQLVFYKRIT